MKTIATVNVILFVVIGGITMYVGFDPQKWRTWLLGLYAFITFFLVGATGGYDLYESMKIATIVTLATLIVGVVTYWNRERAKKWLEEHEKKDT